MSTKTIAVETSVYDRLAREKRESESFTRVISRLLFLAAEAHTGASIAEAVKKSGRLPAREAGRMLAVVRENRAQEAWERRDLR
jgi:predicted CopG family antitoxin